MIISCEKCATKYNVNQDFVGDKGRKVKCTQCNHIWHANITVSESASDPSTNKIISKNPEIILPVAIEKSIPLWIKMLPYPLIILIISLYVIFYSYNIIDMAPMVENLYKNFGIYNSKSLKLENLTLSKIDKSDNNYDIIIEGKIINESEKPRTMPSLRLSILDKNKENIISNLSESDGSIMMPNEEFVINNKITNLDEKAKFIAIDIGNKVELMIR